jgi:hypothetical protein
MLVLTALAQLLSQMRMHMKFSQFLQQAPIFQSNSNFARRTLILEERSRIFSTLKIN